jgi:hypothetical protein
MSNDGSPGFDPVIRAQARAARRDLAERGKERVYETGNYWRDRSDMMYYRYLEFIIRTVARDAGSMIDVGTGGARYLEWFDWIGERVSFDRHPPPEGNGITPVEGDFMTHSFDRRYEVATCLQVLEHVPEPGPFLQKLFSISDLTVISVPYRWPAGKVADHVNDPVTDEKLAAWAGRAPNYRVVVTEPFRAPRRLIAVYDTADTDRYWGRPDVARRIRRGAALAPVESR